MQCALGAPVRSRPFCATRFRRRTSRYFAVWRCGTQHSGASIHALPFRINMASIPSIPSSASSWRKIQVPRPLQQLFDHFPLRAYEANHLPERSQQLTSSDLPTLYVFSTDSDARLGLPSFNPGCLKWQASLEPLAPLSLLRTLTHNPPLSDPPPPSQPRLPHPALHKPRFPDRLAPVPPPTAHLTNHLPPPHSSLQPPLLRPPTEQQRQHLR